MNGWSFPIGVADDLCGWQWEISSLVDNLWQKWKIISIIAYMVDWEITAWSKIVTEVKDLLLDVSDHMPDWSIGKDNLVGWLFPTWVKDHLLGRSFTFMTGVPYQIFVSLILTVLVAYFDWNKRSWLIAFDGKKESTGKLTISNLWELSLIGKLSLKIIAN